ncbi:MAG: RrF2 family transcriptional regulator [Acidimicrobiia bacterium]
MSEGVEWTLHCCTILATLPTGQTLPAAKLAEFHDVPPAYLAKHLQATAAAGITETVPGPRGGYRLARPATEVSVLDVVLAVDGEETAFRCSEIRQQGPTAGPPSLYRTPCGIARAMWRAEDAWRTQLRQTTIADLVADLLVSVPHELLLAGAEWIQQVEVQRGRRASAPRGGRRSRSPRAGRGEAPHGGAEVQRSVDAGRADDRGGIR